MNGKEMLASLRQWWQSLQQTQKIIFAAGLAVILITAIVLGQFVLRPTYAPIFTGLEPKDAAKIIEQLENSRIPYRLTNEGKNIEVPKDQVYETRIQMASAGVLHDSGVGFELFDEKKFGITEYEQHVGYQRALQEELRRTIVQLDSVEQARVHLVLSRQSLFLDEQVTPSVSIALKLKPSTKLEPNQVAGIQSLVMGSVEGLTPENIHIIDMEGNVLNGDLLEPGGGEHLSIAAMERYEIQRAYEKELEARVQQMLNRVLGPGRAASMVTAELDFDREETVRLEHGPGSVLSDQIINESGTGVVAGGIPGMDSEMPGDTMPLVDGGEGSNYTRENRTTNYEVDTLQQTTVKSLGNVKRLSVSVVVDGEYPQATLDSIQQVVATAVGYDVNRGDQIFLSAMPFSSSAIPGLEDEPGAAPAPWWLNTSYLIAAGIVLLALMLLVILLRRRNRLLREEQERLQAEEEARLAAAIKEHEQEIVYKEPSSHRAMIRKVAMEKPSEIVDLIKVWLRE